MIATERSRDVITADKSGLGNITGETFLCEMKLKLDTLQMHRHTTYKRYINRLQTVLVLYLILIFLLSYFSSDKMNVVLLLYSEFH